MNRKRLYIQSPLFQRLRYSFSHPNRWTTPSYAILMEKRTKSHNIGPRSMSSAVRTGKGNRDGTMPYGAVRTDAVVTAKSVPERPASMESDRFGVVGASRCTMAMHDGMKGLVHAVCVHAQLQAAELDDKCTLVCRGGMDCCS